MDEGLALDFSAECQSLEGLEETIYRVSNKVSCRVERTTDGYRCILYPKASTCCDLAIIRNEFLDILADNNLRERIERKVGPTRQLILALAFGALASDGG